MSGSFGAFGLGEVREAASPGPRALLLRGAARAGGAEAGAGGLRGCEGARARGPRGGAREGAGSGGLGGVWGGELFGGREGCGEMGGLGDLGGLRGGTRTCFLYLESTGSLWGSGVWRGGSFLVLGDQEVF